MFNPHDKAKSHISLMISQIKVPIGQVTKDTNNFEISGIDSKSLTITQYPDDVALRLLEWLDIPEGSSGSVSHHFRLVRLVPPRAIPLLQGSWNVHFRGGWQDLTTGDEILEHIPGSITIVRERRHRSFEPPDRSAASSSATMPANQAAPPGFIAIVDEYRMASTYSIGAHDCHYKSTNLWHLVRHGEDLRTIMNNYSWRLQSSEKPVEGDYLWFHVLNEPALEDEGP